ncbi:MAG: hypothetical protein ACYDA9_19730 [Terriglobia bacterium]
MTLKSLAIFSRLTAYGKLPQPRRSIRVLSMGEMYVSMHYVATHPDRVRHTVAAMCVDTPAASYDPAGTEYSFYMNPHVAKSYTEAIMLRVAQGYFPKVGQPWHEHEFMIGTDTYLSEPMVDVPTGWGYSGSGVQAPNVAMILRTVLPPLAARFHGGECRVSVLPCQRRRSGR